MEDRCPVPVVHPDLLLASLFIKDSSGSRGMSAPGQTQTSPSRLRMSAPPLIPDIVKPVRFVCFVPQADSRSRHPTYPGFRDFCGAISVKLRDKRIMTGGGLFPTLPRWS